MGSLNTNQLAVNQSIPAGSWLVSPNGRYNMVMQTNCIVVILDTSTAPPMVVWSSPNQPSQTSQPGVICKMCSNDRLEILLNGVPLAWSTNSPGQFKNPVLCLDNNGVANICMGNCNGTPVWSAPPQVMQSGDAVQAFILEVIHELGVDVKRIGHEVEAIKNRLPAEAGEYQVHESGIPPKEVPEAHPGKKQKAG